MLPILYEQLKDKTMGYKRLQVPTINVNDDKVTLCTMEKTDLSPVKKGDVICCFETSKTSEDFEVPSDGYIKWLVNPGEEMEVGHVFCILFDTKDEASSFGIHGVMTAQETSTEFKASKKAIEYANSIGFELSLIHKDGIIKTEDIDKYLKAETAVEDNISTKIETSISFDKDSTAKRVAIIGAGKCAMQIIDLISCLDGFTAVALFDDTPAKQGSCVDGVPVIGKIDFDLIEEKFKQNCFDYIVQGVGGLCEFRKRCFDELSKRGVPFCNLIHPTAVISSNVKIGVGNVLLPFVFVGPHAVIKNDCFMTARTSIEHHNNVGSHCTFGPGVMMSGSVSIGDCTGFGAGVFVEPYINIGAGCLISSGSILTNHVPDNTVVRTKKQLEYVNRI